MKEIDRLYELECIEVAILKQYAKLGPNAQRVLIALIDRLVLGRVHGDFDKPHDWDHESAEEALDLAVYQAAKLLGLGKAEEPREHVCDGYDCRKCFFDRRDKREAEKAAALVSPSGRAIPMTQTGWLAPDGTHVSLDGLTPDGKPWVPPIGARVRVVFQPPHGKGRSDLVIEGQTLTVAAAGYCFNPDFAEIGFNEHKNGELRHCRVVPA